MSIDPLKELEAAKARVLELQSKFVGELASLPEKYGFKSLDEFVKAVKTASTSKAPARAKAGRKPGRKAAKAAAKPSAPKAEKKARGRARITEEVKAQVKQLIEEGKSGSEIAKTLGISLPSVQNIKKAFGLVKSRVEAPAAPAAAPVADAGTPAAL